MKAAMDCNMRCGHCNNYETCENDNKKVLDTNKNVLYALRGYAIAIHRLGRMQERLEYMRRAVELTGGRDYDLIENLQIMSMNN